MPDGGHGKGPAGLPWRGRPISRPAAAKRPAAGRAGRRALL